MSKTRSNTNAGSGVWRPAIVAAGILLPLLIALPILLRSSRIGEILDATPRVSTSIVVGARGRPIGRSGLTTSFFNLLRELREAGRIGPALSFHGLRHTLGTALAEAGCDPPTIASVLGQATTQMAEHYSRHANRRHHAAAAIERIEARDRKTERKTTL